MKANDELRRKLQQGSQQLQGEVLELALEDLISQTFPSDLVQPVPKGINGADIMQRVQNPNGDLAGSIIWESKRTKAWSDSWIQKIKDDQRQAKADIAILVSDALPKDCNHFKQVGGIWVLHAPRHHPAHDTNDCASARRKGSRPSCWHGWLPQCGDRLHPRKGSPHTRRRGHPPKVHQRLVAETRFLCPWLNKSHSTRP